MPSRALVLALSAICGSTFASFETGGGANDAQSVARALGDAANAQVDPHGYRWGESHGSLGDFLFGRDAWFLGIPRGESTRDLFRTRVRVTPEGRVVATGAVHNITQTQIGDEHALLVRGDRAVFATRAFGQEQSVTLLWLDGEGSQNLTESLSDRAMAYATNVQMTGDPRGVGRVDYTWETPVKNVALQLVENDLRIALTSDNGETSEAFADARDGHLHPPAKDAPVPLVMQAGRHLPKRFVFWAVDSVRAVTGPAPIAWLEERTFAYRDSFRQWSRSQDSSSGETEAPHTPGAVVVTREGTDDTWPPRAIKPILPSPESGEGEWSAVDYPWLKRRKGAPPAFYRSFVRADESRPYTRVIFVAMDMRQLSLDMEAGVEDPKPLTGPPGPGRLPRRADVLDNVVAAFNGGFKTEHGAYGMMVHKRVLLPPVPGAATVLVLNDGRVAMGTWGSSREIGGMRDIDKSEIVSFRQNLDPLLDGDKVNPSERSQWGFTLPGTGMQTERSGLCASPTGYLVYAWGDDVSAPTLAKAMKAAGCNYGMHLDMNPHHTGFSFMDITDVSRKNYRAELISKKMSIAPDRFIEYAPKDFFYVMLRKIDLPEIGGHAFKADEDKQPPPAFIPVVTKSEIEGVVVLRADASRVRFRLVPGSREPRIRGTERTSSALDKGDASDLLFAIGAGFSAEKKLRGLTVGGRHLAAFAGTSGFASLELDGDGVLSLRSGPHESGSGDAIELPLLFDASGDRGARASAVAGTEFPWVLGIAEGAIYVAKGKSVDVTERVLKALNVTQAVILSRGGAETPFLHRVGSNEAPRAQYPESTLYAIGNASKPRVFRVEPEEAVVPKKR